MKYGDLKSLVEIIATQEYNDCRLRLEDIKCKQDLVTLYVAMYENKFKRKPRSVDWKNFTVDEMLMLIDDIDTE